MKKTSLLSGALLGALTSLPVIALSLAGLWLFGLPAYPLDLFDWLARTLPGPIIAFGISTMVTVIGLLHLGPTASTAKLAEQIMGLVIFVLIGALFGAILAFIARRRPGKTADDGMRGGVVLALLMALVEASLGFSSGFLVTIIWLAILFPAWGFVLGRLLNEPAPVVQPAVPEETAVSTETTVSSETIVSPETPESKPAEISRREFLYLGAAGAAAVLVSAVSLNNLRKGLPPTGKASTTPVPTLNPQVAGQQPTATNMPSQAILTKRFPPAPGTRPELTDNADFYRIDINVFPPSIKASDWSLELSGMVNKPLKLSLDDFKSRPSVSQALTMQCISNPVGGDLTSTTVWTGVPLKDILAEAGLQPGVVGLYMEAADGFYEFIHLEQAMDPRTLLVYAMNGVDLPVEHGYPLRIYIPGRYGMKMPKWLTRMEAMSQARAGYWVERGWDPDAIAKTTSVVDTVAVDNEDPKTKTIPVGGIAWAGDRGISKVEVQVDQGPWVQAELRNPPLSSLCWVQWRYDWPAKSGVHDFSVRAYDGTGTLQITDSNPPEWSGATGIYTMHSVTVVE
jgi:DMSO/TMAO reductase YedYZ molybdopterin-dependent catalytic subunit